MIFGQCIYNRDSTMQYIQISYTLKKCFQCLKIVSRKIKLSKYQLFIRRDHKQLIIRIDYINIFPRRKMNEEKNLIAVI